MAYLASFETVEKFCGLKQVNTLSTSSFLLTDTLIGLKINKALVLIYFLSISGVCGEGMSHLCREWRLEESHSILGDFYPIPRW